MHANQFFYAILVVSLLVHAVCRVVHCPAEVCWSVIESLVSDVAVVQQQLRFGDLFLFTMHVSVNISALSTIVWKSVFVPLGVFLHLPCLPIFVSALVSRCLYLLMGRLVETMSTHLALLATRAQSWTLPGIPSMRI